MDVVFRALFLHFQQKHVQRLRGLLWTYCQLFFFLFVCFVSVCFFLLTAFSASLGAGRMILRTNLIFYCINLACRDNTEKEKKKNKNAYLAIIHGHPSWLLLDGKQKYVVFSIFSVFSCVPALRNQNVLLSQATISTTSLTVLANAHTQANQVVLKKEENLLHFISFPSTELCAVHHMFTFCIICCLLVLFCT